MAKKIKITLTDEHIKLISNLRFTEFNDDINALEIEKIGFDLNSLYGGSFLLEDISYILGCYDKHIEGTEDKATGPEFETELMDHMLELHEYIMNNINLIEEIVHQFIGKGGITPGTYSCDRFDHIWKRED